MAVILHLVPHERRAAFEAAGWTVAHDLRPCHHACYAVLMERPTRPGERPEALLAEVAQMSGIRDQGSTNRAGARHDPSDT